MEAKQLFADRKPDVEEIHILWTPDGMSCDGDTISVTAATQPSIEDIVMGAIPGLPKVHLHNRVDAPPLRVTHAGRCVREFSFDAVSRRDQIFADGRVVRRTPPSAPHRLGGAIRRAGRRQRVPDPHGYLERERAV